MRQCKRGSQCGELPAEAHQPSPQRGEQGEGGEREKWKVTGLECHAVIVFLMLRLSLHYAKD